MGELEGFADRLLAGTIRPMEVTATPSMLDGMRAVGDAVRIPVIASGGADTPETFVEVFREGRADAALAASIFHDSVHGLADLKNYLAGKGISVRQAN